MGHTTPHLVFARATKMLGKYDHSFNLIDDYAILFGPNGVRKTKFLEAIRATADLDGHSLLSIPCRQVELTYSDGTILRSQPTPSRPESENDVSDSRGSTRFEVVTPDGVTHSWEYSDDGFYDWVRERSELDQRWQTPTYRAGASVEELREVYSRRKGRRSRESNALPEEFIAVRPAAKISLIETQRLISNASVEQQGAGDAREMRRTRRPRSKIEELSEMLKARINSAETEHSKITQMLDRTFPKRVLSARDELVSRDPEAVRARYARQNEFRARVGRIVDISIDSDLQLGEAALMDWQLTLLDLYMADTEKKLRPFEGLVGRIELLEKVVNSRFLDKSIRVTAQDGLHVNVDRSGESIPLSSLSSGEQHELILMVDLLFNVPKGSTVLVDEPEISLHIAWQLDFIPDMRKIAQLVGFNFVIATHSPQIINDQWSRAVRLGPEKAVF